MFENSLLAVSDTETLEAQKHAFLIHCLEEKDNFYFSYLPLADMRLHSLH